MIKYFQIENFKSIRRNAFSFENLNLFFGMNGMGKSSVIQALLLLRQSYYTNHQKGIDGIYMNGDLARLGTARDIFCQTADADFIRYYIMCSERECYDFKFDYLQDNVDKDFMRRSDDTVSDEERYDDAIFNDHFYYLGAEHLAPQKQYSTEKWGHSTVNPLGMRGEYVVPFLAEYGNRYRVADKLCIKGKSNRLLDQVSAWMAEISPGIKISAELMPLLEQAKLLISYTGERLVTDSILPVNVGFGIPYVLPLVVELLISDENSILLLENPESHLHPRGQTVVAHLTALAAENGSQIICESHSDHFINGIRVAVKKQDLNPNKLTVTYFDKNLNNETKLVQIMVDKNGELSEYPTGLLDEWGVLMSELL